MSATVILGDPGPLVVNTDVDEALISMLRDGNWLRTFLRIVSEERGLAKTLPAPVGASYNNPMDMSEWGDRQFPGIAVATAKTQGSPKRRADGVYGVDWLCVISAIVRGTTAQETRTRAALYEGAVRRSLGHAAVLAGQDLISKIRFRGVEVRPVTTVSRAGRYLAAGMSTFLVTTDSAFKDSAGPMTADPLPTSDDPTPTPPVYVPTGTITEVDFTAEGLTPDQDLGG